MFKRLRSKYYAWQYKKQHSGECYHCHKHRLLHQTVFLHARTRRGPLWEYTAIICEDCFTKLSFNVLLLIYESFVRKHWHGDHAWEVVGKRIEHEIAREKRIDGYLDFVIDCPLLME